MYRNALVMGLGASGEAAARLLRAEGTDVTVIDAATGPALELRKAALAKEGIAVGLGAAEPPPRPFDVCVLSPGIPADSKWIAAVEGRGTEVMPEIDLAARRCRCPLIAVTGTNGKSTMVKFCGDVLREAGLRVEVGGNYGPPFSSLVGASAALDWLVLEVSSFQLERAATFKPRVGVLLNLQPNHLDRHPDMASYTRAKLRMFARMDAQDVGIVLDELLDDVARRSPGANRWVSFGATARADFRYADACVVWNKEVSGRAFVAGSVFADNVRGLTAAAAAAVAVACGLKGEWVTAAARIFKPLPHRLQTLGEIDGVRFVNDSKATTLAALRAALDVMPGNVRLIAGGLLKQHDLDTVKEVLANKVKTVYLIGDAAKEMAAAWEESVPCRQCGTLDRAVRQASDEARRGEVILLSPGCASFDQFSGFEQRGEAFAQVFQARRSSGGKT